MCSTPHFLAGINGCSGSVSSYSDCPEQQWGGTVSRHKLCGGARPTLKVTFSSAASEVNSVPSYATYLDYGFFFSSIKLHN